MRLKVNALLDEIWSEHADARALFLTLTLPTQPLRGASLAPLQRALKRFWAMPEVLEHTLGQLTSIEAKVSGTNEEPTLHFHAHCLVIVPADYYFATGLPRIHQTVWARWWQKASRLDRKPVVDIRAVRAPDGATDSDAARGAVREVAKYAISTSFFEHSNDGIRVDPLIALALHAALRSKRLVRVDRCFKAAEKRLKQKAEANRDLSPSEAS